MPVALLRDSRGPGFAPVARPRFLIGRDLDCDLVDTSPGVEEHHATVRYRRGEYLLKAEEGCSVWMGGERFPFVPLRDGDFVQMSPQAEPWRFRSRVEGTFWPPEIQVGEAWLSHPACSEPENGPERFGLGPPVGCSDPDRSRLVGTPYGPWIVKRMGPVRDGHEANEYLRFLAALGGAPHPGLACLVDGGIAPLDGEPRRWMATNLAEGTSADGLVSSGGATAWQVLQVLRCLAEALRHLHHRGIVHRAVSPENVVLSKSRPAVLIDYGWAWSSENPVRVVTELPETRFLAPEARAEDASAYSPALDIYGMCATGFALLTGTPPASDEDVRAALIRARRENPTVWELDLDATRILIGVLTQGLALDPAARPDAVRCTRTLAFGVAHGAVWAAH